MLLKKLKQIFNFFLKAGQRQICFELQTSKEVAVERLEEFLDDYFDGVVSSEEFTFYSKDLFFSDLRFQGIVIRGKFENTLPNCHLTITFRMYLILEVLYLLSSIFFAVIILKGLFFSSAGLLDKLLTSIFLLIFPVMIRSVFQYRLHAAENKFIEYLGYLFNKSELREVTNYP